MFHFFKSYYLRDFLDGFVDIHCHILPGIDDGAQNVNEAIELIRGLNTLGINQFIPTPHIMQDFYPNNEETIGNAYQKLLEHLESDLKSKITLNPSAEYMIDHNFERLLEKKHLFPLLEKFILIEMSYFQQPINLHEIVFKIQSLGYTPIIAHPERYSFFHNNLDNYLKLKQMGCLFQLNLLSLSDHYGKPIQKSAYKLIRNNLIDFAGTDSHNINHVEKLSKLKLDKKVTSNIKAIITKTKNQFSVV